MAEYFRCNKCNGTFDPAHTYCPNCDVVAVKELEAENARLREELAAAQVDAKRYRWLRSRERGMSGLSTVINDDCQPPYYELKCEAELDVAIDDAIAKENGK